MEQIDNLAPTHTRKEVSEKLNIKYSTVTAYLRRHNIEAKPSEHKFGGRPEGAFDKKPRKKPQKKLHQAIKLIAGNYPVEKIMKVFNIHSLPPIEKISDIKFVLPYQLGSKIKKFSDHIGQRKLMLNEIQFLSKCKSKYCIYAGSAPGNKTYYLSTLFPHIKFILIDPNKFNLIVDGKSHRDVQHRDIVHIATDGKYEVPPHNIVNFIESTSYKIYIIEDYMTVEFAEQLKVFQCDFISDIRSNIYMKEYPTDFDVIWNTSMMYNWINIMKPCLSMLKIRMPYGGDDIEIKKDKYIMDEFEMSKKYGIDFFHNYLNNIFVMSDSELYIQPWAGESSTELRMVIRADQINNVRAYDIQEIEGKMAYYNNIDRAWNFHYNANADKSINFCNCNDCALENKIWADFGFNKKQTQEAVVSLGKITNRELSHVHRYPIYSILEPTQVLERAKLWKSLYKYHKKRNNKGDLGKTNKKGGSATTDFVLKQENQKINNDEYFQRKLKEIVDI